MPIEMLAAAAGWVGKLVISEFVMAIVRPRIHALLDTHRAERETLTALGVSIQRLLEADRRAAEIHLEHALLADRSADDACRDLRSALALYIRAAGNAAAGEIEEALARRDIAVCAGLLGDALVARAESATALALACKCAEAYSRLTTAARVHLEYSERDWNRTKNAIKEHPWLAIALLLPQGAVAGAYTAYTEYRAVKNARLALSMAEGKEAACNRLVSNIRTQLSIQD